jgi:hypothetical protein
MSCSLDIELAPICKGRTIGRRRWGKLLSRYPSSVTSIRLEVASWILIELSPMPSGLALGDCNYCSGPLLRPQPPDLYSLTGRPMNFTFQSRRRTTKDWRVTCNTRERSA